jgi:hypothetical protein
MKPVPGGVIKVNLGLESISPFSLQIPTPILLALPSMPKANSFFYFLIPFDMEPF